MLAECWGNAVGSFSQNIIRKVDKMHSAIKMTQYTDIWDSFYEKASSVPCSHSEDHQSISTCMFTHLAFALQWFILEYEWTTKYLRTLRKCLFMRVRNQQIIPQRNKNRYNAKSRWHILKIHLSWKTGMVAHICRLSYLGGWSRRFSQVWEFKASLSNITRPHLKKKIYNESSSEN